MTDLPKTDQAMRKLCDNKLTSIMQEMQDDGASVEMIIDRLLTLSAAQLCHMEGAFKAGRLFRDIANQIDAGSFARVEPARKGRGH